MSRRHPPELTAGLLAVLGFVAAVGPVATDMYLASFTDIAAELGASAASVQLTLTSFLAGIAVGQLLIGPLSDSMGRRRLLLIALTVFALSGIALIASPTITFFIVVRAVQGLCGAAGVVIARAVAADLSTGPTAVRALSLIATVGALGPLIAPPVGGVVAQLWGWRGVMAVLAAISVTMLIAAAVAVPETLPASARHAGGVVTAFRRIGGLMHDGVFAAYILTFALAFATMMAYISASPFVGQAVLGMSPLVYSLAFASGATSLILANLLNARIAPKVGPGRMLVLGVTLQVIAAAAMTVLALTGTLTAWSFIAAAFVVTGGCGVCMSNASALALARTTPESRGAGSAVLGSGQFVLGAIASPVVGLWGEHTAVPMALTMLVTALAASALVYTAKRAGR